MNNITFEQAMQMIDDLIAKVSYIDSLELIDAAAREDRLYHHNGGQAYIRINMNQNILMIVDHTSANRARVSLHDGTAYFEECKDYNWSHSKRLREHSTTMVEWYTKHTQLYELDLV